MKKLRGVSLSGIVVLILAIFISLIGVKDYQQQKLRINDEYKFKLHLAEISLRSEMLSIQLNQTRLVLENDPQNKKIIARDITSKKKELKVEKFSSQEKLKQQRKEELNGRIFNLLTYISLAITFFIFGISLFWRKKDAINTEEQQKLILTYLSEKSHDLEQIKESLQAQNVILNKGNPQLDNAYKTPIHNSQSLIKEVSFTYKTFKEIEKQIAAAREKID